MNTPHARLHRSLMLAAIAAAAAATASAQETPELAKQAQNPVAHLISVPFQNNFNFGVGPENDLQDVLNIQPVVPFRLDGDWNLITRTIVPVIHQPELAPGVAAQSGLGDVLVSLFLSPAKPGDIIWGVGPAISLPTATNRVLGSGKLSLGLSAVALTIQGPWVGGLLVNDIASVAGDSDRGDVDQMVIQPFVNYNMKEGWYLTSSPLMTANWKAASGQKWTVPLGGGVGRVFHADHQALNAQMQVFANAAHPDGAATWSLRLQLELLFPG